MWSTHLNLVDVGRPDLRVFLHLFNMPDAKIADTDTLCLALIVQLLKSLPLLLSALLGSAGAVNEEQVNVLSLGVDFPDAVQAALVGLLRGAARVQNLGGEENILARDAALLDCVADFLLILVELRGVDVPVTVIQGRETGLHADVCERLVDTETQLGNCSSAAQREGIIDSALRHGYGSWLRT